MASCAKSSIPAIDPSYLAKGKIGVWIILKTAYMKKLLLLLVCSGFAAVSFTQDQPDPKRLSRNDYLKKARTQSTIGWVLVGTGAVFFILPATDNGNNNPPANDEVFRIELDLDGYYYATGAVLLGASIPFFIASSRNKEKAAALTTFFRLEKTERQAAILFRTPAAFPAAGIRIRIP